MDRAAADIYEPGVAREDCSCAQGRCSETPGRQLRSVQLSFNGAPEVANMSATTHRTKAKTRTQRIEGAG